MCPGAAPGQPDRCAGPGTGTSVIASYYPPAHGSGPWATLKPEVAGYRSDGLRAAAQYAASQGNSRSFLLLKDGMIIWESCWGDSSTSIETPTFWASAQKSFTASATLAAASQGKLSLSSTGAISYNCTTICCLQQPMLFFFYNQAVLNRMSLLSVVASFLKCSIHGAYCRL